MPGPTERRAGAGDEAVGRVVVRLARPDEVERLRRIEVDAGQRFATVDMGYVAADEAAPPAWYLERQGQARLWVADDARDDVVGYAAASEVDGEAHLDQVSVLGSHSGQGIGRALVSAVEAWARDRGHRAVTLTTYRDVPWNGPWYRSLGYVEVPGDRLGAELAAIRRAEAARGLDRHPRLAMRIELA